MVAVDVAEKASQRWRKARQSTKEVNCVGNPVRRRFWYFRDDPLTSYARELGYDALECRHGEDIPTQRWRSLAETLALMVHKQAMQGSTSSHQQVVASCELGSIKW